MSDATIRTLDREAEQTQDPVAMARARYARIRAGLEPMPELARYLVLDPLHLEPLRKKVAKFSRVAVARGGLPLTLWEADEAQWIERAREDGTTALIRVREVAILGDVPDAGAWGFVAQLHHLPSGTILRRAPGAKHLSDETLEQYRARGPVCDHCEARRLRTYTYVVRNRETGEVAQVGASCLEAYTSASPNAAVYAFDVRRELTEEMENCAKLDDAPRSDVGMPLLPALAVALYRRVNGTGSGSLMDGVGRLMVAPMEFPFDLWEKACGMLDLARGVMLPALAEERRLAAEREAGREATWSAAVERLPERLHNVSVVVAEGVASYREEGRVSELLLWAERRENERFANDPVAGASLLAGRMAPLGVAPAARGLAEGAIVLSPRDLAALLTAVANGGGRELLAACREVSPEARTVAVDDVVVLADGKEGRIGWIGRGRTGVQTARVHVQGEYEPRWIPVAELVA